MRKGLKMRMMTERRNSGGGSSGVTQREQDYDPQSNSWTAPQYGGMMRGGMYRRGDDDDAWGVAGYYERRGDDRRNEGGGSRREGGYGNRRNEGERRRDEGYGRWRGDERRNRGGRDEMRRRDWDDDWDDDDDEEEDRWERRNRAKPEEPVVMDKETAERWVKSMTNEDAAHPTGGRWKPEELKPLAQKVGMPTEGSKFWEFYAVANAMYSDFSEVGKKFGITSPDFYACMAKAWMEDKDAVKDKAAMYYEYIVKK